MGAQEEANEKRERRMRRNLWAKSRGGFNYLRKGELINQPVWIDIATIREMPRVPSSHFPHILAALETFELVTE